MIITYFIQRGWHVITLDNLQHLLAQGVEIAFQGN